ncbi:hypothetical protein BVG16_01840 [Paenibacillus selenitireducens]|uniref:Capsule synthesis protein CapA domain-containing protein n=1 Tax=Paenibacillus selenitireducens TaxID=1324314 RepID=A0A1T2XMK8_9BACL|nr:CapA family protein [Paenibacillus selenitireducens]OPA81104.1 hypothetical protein BVG16_01840 [Paenibacillus selenitireducens]
MYITRSDAHRAKKTRKKRKIRMLLTVNLIMLAIIIGLGGLYLANQRSESPQEANAVQDTNAGTVAKPDDSPEGDGADQTGTEETVEPEDAATNHPAEDTETGTTSPATNEGAGANKEQPSSDKNGDGQDHPAVTKKPVTDNKIQAVLPEGDGLLFSFVGDIQMSGKVDEIMRKNGYDFPFQYAKSLFQKDDLTVANLETPITVGGLAETDKQFVFKSSPDSAAALHNAGIDVVTLANNHVLDQGVSGLKDTIQHLDSANVQHVGAGNNDDEAYTIKYVERKGKRVAILGFSRVVPKASWKAGPKNAGVAETYNSTKAVAQIKEARKQADIVIVMVHWGIEKAETPNQIQKQLAHEYVDAGADLVIGSHPHVLQGMEQYKGKWIAYSLGNFIFTRSTNPMTWETAVLQVTYNSDGSYALKLIPYHANLGQAVPMDEANGSKLLQRVSGLSQSMGAGIRNDGLVGTITR